MPLEKVDKTNYPTEGEKERLQSLAKQLKGLNAFQRKTIYDEMVQIIDPYITKAYIERLDEELKKFAPVSNTK